jgi:hypothetical protein
MLKSLVQVEVIFSRSKFGENSPVKETLGGSCLQQGSLALFKNLTKKRKKVRNGWEEVRFHFGEIHGGNFASCWPLYQTFVCYFMTMTRFYCHLGGYDEIMEHNCFMR